VPHLRPSGIACARCARIAAFDPQRIVTAVDYDAKSFNCRAKAGAPNYAYKVTDNTRIRVKGQRARLRATVEYHLSGQDRIAERIAIYPAKK
jgi:hypothetical protein